MDDQNLKEMAESLVKEVNFDNLFPGEEDDEDQINFWIPAKYKIRFKALNKESKYKLGQLIKELIMKCVDQADQRRRVG